MDNVLIFCIFFVKVVGVALALLLLATQQSTIYSINVGKYSIQEHWGIAEAARVYLGGKLGMVMAGHSNMAIMAAPVDDTRSMTS